MPSRRPAASPLPAPDLDPAHDPGVALAATRGARAAELLPSHLIGRPLYLDGDASREIRVGTASWTDPTTVRSGFYPAGTSTAEARLRYYASQFPVVEVDSSYYALPDRATAQLWAERTPGDFRFYVKAHALMTGQPTEVSRLPEALIDELPASLAGKSRLYGKDLHPELLDAVWARFLDALSPLADADKLGGILLQFPKWFLPTPENRDLLAGCAARLAGIPASVEFRNRRWYTTTSGDERAAQWTLDLLRSLGLTYVMVDGPAGLESSVPPMAGVTTPALAMVRLHGRRSATWEAPGVPTVERYRYLYDREELTGWIPKIESASAEATHTVVLMNNCYGNYGATNAMELMAMLATPHAPSNARA